MLVETEWLAEHLGDHDLVIIDASPTEKYIDKHIKNAVSASFSPKDYLSDGISISYGGGVDLFTDPESSIPFQDGPPEYVAEMIRNLGISRESTVVIYDEGANFLATRFFWTLTFHGHERAFILNGGLKRWIEESLPISQDKPKIEKRDFILSIPDPSMAVDTDYVLASLNNSNIILVDATRPSWYYGSYSPYSRRGHIPTAINFPWTYLFGDDKLWKSAEDLKEMFEFLDILPDKEIIASCGGNPAASALFFGLKHLLGYPNVKYYPESRIGWLADPRNLPLNTYANEHLLKDAEWVQGFFANERMQHLVRDSGVRVVDIRDEDKYKAGHIPYAVNIPIEDLLYNTYMRLSDWEGLLGSKGITEEVKVVVYGDQRNLVSSLFFWLMEFFGHKRVSILSGGLEAWINAGFELSKMETKIAKPKHKFDVVFSPTSYKIMPRKQKCLFHQKEETEYSEISRRWLIASSEKQDVSKLNLDIEYAHIPWEDNLDDIGNIRNAGELFSIYESAGISKCTEIVCYSESVREMTFSYFILRLLGYPKVKVFLPERGFLIHFKDGLIREMSIENSD